MPFRLALSATFTAEPIEPVLAFWGRQLQVEFEIRFAPYNQVTQTLIGPASDFVTNQHGVNIVLFRLEDLGAATRIEANLHDLVEQLRDAPQRTNVPLIAALCPPSPGFLVSPERTRFAHEMSSKAEAMLDETPGLIFLSHQEIDRLYPVPAPATAEGERLGRIPYTELYFAALGTALVRMTHGLLLPPFKAISLDCDNTLWRGICGEDGAQGIVVDPFRRRLQQFMLDQRDQGMLLVMASKNNERDVLDAFEQNPEMPLQLRHFVAWRLDWESKSANLRALATELSLGLDSFVFIDDNPKECAEAAESVPEALTLALPPEDWRIPQFLEHIWAFDHVVITEEDRNRNAYYVQAQEFGRELKKAATLRHFAQTLELQVRFQPLTPDRMARAAQLTQRTNQFNFTTIRRTEPELRALLNQGALEGITLEVADRFGDYGLTGVVLFKTTADALEIDTFLLSCRVLGRGVEHRVLAHLASEALLRGLPSLIAVLHPTAKNAPAQQFLREIEACHEEAAGLIARLPAAEFRNLTWNPRAAEPWLPRQERVPKPSTATRRPDYARIANSLSTPAQILDAVRAQSGAPLSDPSLTETEGRLAKIWSDLLQKPAIHATDNFFDLGGHSLLAVLLIVRVREAFNVELPIDDVYAANLTLRGLAWKIDAYDRGDNDLMGYEALVQEIEGMSDEEVRRLLAEEER